MHLVEKVIPEVQVRQWVCSLPWRLRVLLGYDRRLCADVLEAFVASSAAPFAAARRRLDLCARIAAHIPPPKFHLIRYRGVLSSHAKLRPELVPKVDDKGPVQLALLDHEQDRVGCGAGSICTLWTARARSVDVVGLGLPNAQEGHGMSVSETTPRALVATAQLFVDRFGDGLDLHNVSTGEEVTLFPANGNNVTYTVTLKYSDGTPAPGRTVRCRSEPVGLTGAPWRALDSLAPRFGGSEARIRQLVTTQVVRLSVRVTPTETKTDANGVASFQLDAFHLGGNEASPAADRIIASSDAGESVATVKCAVMGMSALVDNESLGLTTSGLVGRHLHPQLASVLYSIGQAWQKVGGKPPGMPNYIVITGASLRWGGLNPPHMTHRFGGTVDIRPIGTAAGNVSVGDAHYHKQATAILVDFLRQTGATEIRFADNLPGVTAVDPSHRNHIHASWLERPTEPWLVGPSDQRLKQVTGISILQQAQTEP